MNPDIARLITQLNDPDPDQRLAAADALGQVGASNEDTRGLIKHGIPALSAALHNPDRDVRLAAAYALGAIGDSSAIPALVEAYHRADEDNGLRLVIVKALGKT